MFPSLLTFCAHVCLKEKLTRLVIGLKFGNKGETYLLTKSLFLKGYPEFKGQSSKYAAKRMCLVTLDFPCSGAPSIPAPPSAPAPTLSLSED